MTRCVCAQMCVSWCLRCSGLSLVPLALVCALSNILLLLPELSTRFLLDGHVTREATWGGGLWGGLVVRQPARGVCHTCGVCESPRWFGRQGACAASVEVS